MKNRAEVTKRILLMTGLLFFVTLLTLLLVKQQKSSEPINTPALAKTAKVMQPKQTPTPTTKPLAQAVIKKPTNVALGIVVDDYANTNGTLTTLEQTLQHTIAVVSIFKQFGNNNKYLDLNALSYIKTQGKTLQLAWEPWNPDQGNNQSTDYLKDIANGADDDYIKTFAQGIKAYGSPVILRFGHEMNGDWYPWGRRPHDYVAAYQHIHTVFLQEGVTNVQWMWCVNITNSPSELAQYYPGDAVVDIIGIDGFNFGTTRASGGWRSFADLFGPTYNYLTSTHNKPVTIAETASTEMGGNKATWITDMYAQLASNFPKVTQLVWFDIIKETDWRIDSSQASLNAFKHLL